MLLNANVLKNSWSHLRFFNFYLSLLSSIYVNRFAYVCDYISLNIFCITCFFVLFEIFLTRVCMCSYAGKSYRSSFIEMKSQ